MRKEENTTHKFDSLSDAHLVSEVAYELGFEHSQSSVSYSKQKPAFRHYSSGGLLISKRDAWLFWAKRDASTSVRF